MTYKEAYDESMKTGKPLFVILGATWCPACLQVKAVVSRLPPAVMSKVVYAYVDIDSDSKSAKLLQTGNSIPELILFKKDGEEWKRRTTFGAKNAADLIKLLSS